MRFEFIFVDVNGQVLFTFSCLGHGMYNVDVVELPVLITKMYKCINYYVSNKIVIFLRNMLKNMSELYILQVICEFYFIPYQI